MGTDAAPRVEIEGARAAVRESDLDVVLVGDEARVRALLGASEPRIEIRHAAEAILPGDPPAIAVKQKKGSSMRVCFDLVKAGDADAVVSAGNSGAMMACGLFVLGRLAAIERPAILTSFPTRRGQCAVLDVGANVEPRPSVLAQFGVMGSVYARLRNRRERPSVGLLSNGAEEHKGTALTREAHRLLGRAGQDGRAAEFDYVGYVEGRDIFHGAVDVAVTDGFTGNVLLKSGEGIAEMVLEMVREEVARGGPLEKLGAMLMRPALRRFRQRTDYAETGAAPLVGVEGVVLICHGGSDARAMKNAILAARDFARADLRQELARAAAAHAYLWQDEAPGADAAGAAGGRPS